MKRGSRIRGPSRWVRGLSHSANEDPDFLLRRRDRDNEKKQKIRLCRKVGMCMRGSPAGGGGRGGWGEAVFDGIGCLEHKARSIAIANRPRHLFLTGLIAGGIIHVYSVQYGVRWGGYCEHGSVLSIGRRGHVGQLGAVF